MYVTDGVRFSHKKIKLRAVAAPGKPRPKP